MTLVITTLSVELSSHPDIFNGGDGIVETSILVPRLVVAKFEVGLGVGDGECSGFSFFSSAVTGVSKEEKLFVAQPTVVHIKICGETALRFLDKDKHSLLEVFEFQQVLIFIACYLFFVDPAAASFVSILFSLPSPDIASFFVALFCKKACTQSGDMLLTGTLLLTMVSLV